MKRRRGLIAVALIYRSGRVLWSPLAQSEREFTSLYPRDRIVGRHLNALADELRAWRELET